MEPSGLPVKLPDSQIDIDSLEPGPQTDGLVAERIMGWTDIKVRRVGASRDYLAGRCPSKPLFQLIPQFSLNPSVAYEMETEIERQGWREKYAEFLYDEVVPDQDVLERVKWFAIRHASPLQCCKAALKVAKEDL